MNEQKRHEWPGSFTALTDSLSNTCLPLDRVAVFVTPTSNNFVCCRGSCFFAFEIDWDCADGVEMAAPEIGVERADANGEGVCGSAPVLPLNEIKQ